MFNFGRGKVPAHMELSWVLLTLLPLASFAWPNYLLDDGCIKGMNLVNTSDSLPPTIMGVIPFERDDLFIIENEANSTPIHNHGDVQAGTQLTLKYSGTHNTQGGTHIAFAVSSGWLSDSKPCGTEGARLLATTRGSAFRWSATWTPGPQLGPATVAVSMAHVNFGTPSVQISRFRLSVIASAASEL